MKTINYLGYTITPNITGYVNFDVYLTNDCDALVRHGESVEDCKNQINIIVSECLLDKIHDTVLLYNEPNGSMVQFEIDGITYDVDYSATIEPKDGMKSGSYDTPNDPDTLTVTINEIEIRNIFDKDGEMLELGNINNQFYIL